MHLPQHQELLRAAAQHGGIDSVMAIIEKENGRALHIETGERETLSERRFFHQPRTMVPMKSCVHIYNPRAAAVLADQRDSGGANAVNCSSEDAHEAGELAADVV